MTYGEEFCSEDSSLCDKTGLGCQCVQHAHLPHLVLSSLSCVALLSVIHLVRFSAATRHAADARHRTKFPSVPENKYGLERFETRRLLPPTHDVPWHRCSRMPNSPA